MGFLSRFEGKMEDTFEGAADKMFDAPISPVQIAKKAEKQMKREKMVGAGKQYAPTLYTVLVNAEDDRRLFGYYPTLAGETETYLAAKASEQGLVMDGQPLVRFIVDDGLKHGKFDVIAEAVAAPIIAQLREEEMQRYGLAAPGAGYGAVGRAAANPYAAPAPAPAPAPAQPYGQPQPYAAPAPAPAPAAYDYDQGYGQGYDQGLGNQGYDQGFGQDYQDYSGYDDFAQPAPQPQAQPGYVPVEELDRPIAYDDFSFDAPATPAVPVAAPAPAQAPLGAAAAGAMAGAAAGHAAVAADTVVFAGGAQAATPVPAQAAVRARLVDTANNRAYDLATSRLLIGRESKNDIAVQDINASRTHAELRRDPSGVWVLTDLGSTNGTFVNGREIGSQPLSDGDRITIGVTNFVFTQA